MKAVWFITLATLVATPAFARPNASEKAPVSASGMTLRDAYQREFAFLAGQKRQLSQRLGQVKTQTRSDQQKIQAEIQSLESKLLGLEGRSQDIREQLLVAEQAQQTSVDDEQLVSATLEQARTTLADYGIEVPEAKDDADRAALLNARFDKAVELLKRLSSVSRTKGEFFGKNGMKVDGEIIRVGRIAAYGVSDKASGALAPAGGGKLKIWKDADGDTARALAKNAPTTSLSVFLFESLDTQVDDGEGETIIEHVDSGGAIAWVIVALGMFGLFLAGLRALLLSRAAGNSEVLEDSVGGLVRGGNYAEAMEAARRASGSAARVVTSVLTSLRAGVDDVEDVVSEAILTENRRINRFGAIILVIAAVAPLLGLLGTVTGMISTFDIITKYGTGDPKMLSGGISTALVTTELGLIVAIPTLLLGNLLKGWADGIETDIERTVLRVLNIHKDVQHATGSENGAQVGHGDTGVPEVR